MTYNHPTAGPNHVGEYQISGIPFVVSGSVTAGTPVQHSFPYVTRDIYFRNRGTNTLIIAFSKSGSLGTARFTLNPSESLTLNVRCKEIFFNASSGSTFYEAVAGTTRVPYSAFPVLTASNEFQGVG